MASDKSKPPVALSGDGQRRPLFQAEQSQYFQQARARWQHSWQQLMAQCRDCFIRY